MVKDGRELGPFYVCGDGSKSIDRGMKKRFSAENGLTGSDRFHLYVLRKKVSGVKGFDFKVLTVHG